MKCEICGTEIAPDRLECPLCGTPVTQPARPASEAPRAPSPMAAEGPYPPPPPDASPVSGSPTLPNRAPDSASWTGSPFEAAPSDHSSRPPGAPVNGARHRPSLGLVLVVALTVLALSAGVVLVFTRGSSTDTGSGPTSLTSTTSVQTATTAPPTDTLTDSETGQTSQTVTASNTTTPSGSVTLPALVGVVELDQDLVNEPTARQAAAALSAFFTAVSERRFRDAFALYTSSARKRLGSYSSWSAGYATTTYEGITLNAVDSRAGGVVTAHVTFTSRQAPRNAPDGSSECLVWDIAYRLVPVSGSSPFHIDRAQSDAPSGTKPFRPCP